MSPDPYTTLGVNRGASADEIKRAYRRLAHQHHPDKDSGDEEKFKEVNAAYQILSDDTKRAQYDQFGQTFDDTGTGPGGFAGADFGDLGDIFEQFFGGAGRPKTRRSPRGQDIAVDATISFSKAATGTKHTLQHRLHQTCSICHGNGAEPGTPIKECSTCHGQGEVSSTRQTMLGTFTQRTPCPTCQGEGKQAETPCHQCRGTGRELKDRELTVDIPAGIADGQTIRLSGKGEVGGNGSHPGDLFVNVHVKPHPSLSREGNNIRSSVNISFADAALGTDITIETLDGDQPLRIPPGTQPGAELSLGRLGFPSLNSSDRGEHIVTINVEVPRRLTRHQKKLLTELRSSKKRRLFS